MRKFVVLIGLLLAGCNTPSPEFHGVDAQRISIGKSTFDVRVKGRRAEAIRLNPEYAPRMAAVAPRMVMAIEKVSGCRVRRLDGDQAMGRAYLNCGEQLPPLPKARKYDCTVDKIYHGLADLYCEPVI